MLTHATYLLVSLTLLLVGALPAHAQETNIPFPLIDLPSSEPQGPEDADEEEAATTTPPAATTTPREATSTSAQTPESEEETPEETGTTTPSLPPPPLFPPMPDPEPEPVPEEPEEEATSTAAQAEPFIPAFLSFLGINEGGPNPYDRQRRLSAEDSGLLLMTAAALGILGLLFLRRATHPPSTPRRAPAPLRTRTEE